MTRKAEVKITPAKLEPEQLEALAQSIEQISAAAKKLFGSRLNDKTVIMLISHYSGVSQANVKLVLSHAMALGTHTLKPVKK